MKILSKLNLNGNELENVVLDLVSSDPGSPIEGQVWYNTTDDAIKYYNGTSVIVVGNIVVNGGVAFSWSATADANNTPNMDLAYIASAFIFAVHPTGLEGVNVGAWLLSATIGDYFKIWQRDDPTKFLVGQLTAVANNGTHIQYDFTTLVDTGGLSNDDSVVYLSFSHRGVQGPNNVTTSTTTNITGFINGDGSHLTYTTDVQASSTLGADVATALGYTPYNGTSLSADVPSNTNVTTSTATNLTGFLKGNGSTIFVTTDVQAASTLAADVSAAYGYTPYNSANLDSDVGGLGYLKPGASPAPNGTYTVGIGGTQNGTITITNGIITAVVEAIP